MKIIHPHQYPQMAINTINIISHVQQEKLNTIDTDVIMLD